MFGNPDAGNFSSATIDELNKYFTNISVGPSNNSFSQFASNIPSLIKNTISVLREFNFSSVAYIDIVSSFYSYLMPLDRIIHVLSFKDEEIE